MKIKELEDAIKRNEMPSVEHLPIHYLYNDMWLSFTQEALIKYQEKFLNKLRGLYV